MAPPTHATAGPRRDPLRLGSPCTLVPGGPASRASFARHVSDTAVAVIGPRGAWQVCPPWPFVVIVYK
eukprot:4050931-Prymnesium_polylepis.1